MDQPSSEITVPVVEAASDALGCGVEDLPPLSESVSLDALDAIVSDPSQDVTVTFSYAGLRVLVRSGQTVYVQPVQEEQVGTVPRR